MIFIALGSSIGNAEEIFRSTKMFLQNSGINIVKQSKILKNPPYGGTAKNEFSNAVWQIEFCRGGDSSRPKIHLDTKQAPKKLLKILQACENAHGRKRDKHWDDRTLDLDILMFHDEIINTKDLTIPHPEIANRLFVLQPWSEIVDNDFKIPALGRLQKYLQKVKNK